MTAVTFRPLHPANDCAIVADRFARAADYGAIETGLSPDAATTDDFFTDAPPGIDPSVVDRLGLFNGRRLDGIAELAFGYPDPADVFLGLMLLTPKARGQGLGPRFLHQIEIIASCYH